MPTARKLDPVPKNQLGLRERNRLRTRDEILVAMSVLLGEQAFESITVDDVSQRAGVSRGTIYTYFPEGREQLVREAYLRIADAVATSGEAEREQYSAVSERIVALARTLVHAVVTPEGRFYGMLGPALFGPLGGVTGSASRRFHTMLVADLDKARTEGALHPDAPVEDFAVLLSGALREIGATAAREPERAPELLQALRMTCDALLTKHQQATL